MEKIKGFAPGSVAVVATPLGNMGDFTARAIEVLGAADIVAAEDTRTAARLLSAHNIKNKLVSYHDWNESARAQWLIEKLEGGARIAVISEAGTPGISDPGFDLVRAARERGFKVFPVPGPSALVAFLSVSGLPTDSFGFFGFTPQKSKKRKDLFKSLAGFEHTMVFYESPHRTAAALADALEVMGERQAALGREMTKVYEEYLYMPLSELARWAADQERIRGEVVWGVAGRKGGEAGSSEEELEQALADALTKDKPPKELSRELAERFGMSAKEIYKMLLERR